jgi:LysM repeat protein
MHRKKIILSLMLVALFFLPGYENYLLHTVKKNETLYGIARTYKVAVGDLESINGLSEGIIKPGQVLRIPFVTSREYRVKNNDNLESIARIHGTNAETLKRLNHLKSDVIKPGMVLRLPRSPREGETYTVEAGDTLTLIALLYNVNLDSLKKSNDLGENDTIKPGQTLVVPERKQIQTASSTPPLTLQGNRYKVVKGDTLWGLSRRWGVGVEEIIKTNNLVKEVLAEGQILQIPVRKNPPVKQDSLLGYYALLPMEGMIDHGTGPYFHFSPRSATQYSEKYGEEYHRKPADNYKKGLALLSDFEASVGKMKKTSRILEGYTIVLDPGHGGDDPGFVVGSTNQQGETVYLVEDEYNYDVALRVYRLLVLNGAKVRMTILSPNHHIRRTSDPSLTFVNEKNEVYNSFAMNSSGSVECYPDGNLGGLIRRRQVARELFAGTPVKKRIFVSIHSDNNPGLSRSPYVIYDGINQEETESNKAFAELVAAGMGNGTSFGEQDILVLNDNPAPVAVLIEVRNISYPENAWAIRNDESREKDAVQIVNGIIHYVRSVK